MALKKAEAEAVYNHRGNVLVVLGDATTELLHISIIVPGGGIDVITISPHQNERDMLALVKMDEAFHDKLVAPTATVTNLHNILWTL